MGFSLPHSSAKERRAPKVEKVDSGFRYLSNPTAEALVLGLRDLIRPSNRVHRVVMSRV